MKREGFLIVQSLLAAFQVIVASSVLAEVTSGTAAAIIAMFLGAFQAGATVYFRDQVTPLSDPRDDLGRDLVPIPRIER